MGAILGGIMAWIFVIIIISAFAGVWMGILAIYYRYIAATELGDSSAGPLLQSIDDLNRSLNKAEKALECTQKIITGVIAKHTVAIDGAERHALLMRAIADTYKSFRGQDYNGTEIDRHFDIDSFAGGLLELENPRKAVEDALTQYTASSAERVAKNTCQSSVRATVLNTITQRIANSDRRISSTQHEIRSSLAKIKPRIALLCN